MCKKPTSGLTEDASNVNCTTELCPPTGWTWEVNNTDIITDNDACQTCKDTPLDCFSFESKAAVIHEIKTQPEVEISIPPTPPGVTGGSQKYKAALAGNANQVEAAKEAQKHLRHQLQNNIEIYSDSDDMNEDSSAVALSSTSEPNSSSEKVPKRRRPPVTYTNDAGAKGRHTFKHAPRHPSKAKRFSNPELSAEEFSAELQRINAELDRQRRGSPRQRPTGRQSTVRPATLKAPHGAVRAHAERLDMT